MSAREESKASRPGVSPSAIARPPGWTVKRPVRLVWREIRLARPVHERPCARLARAIKCQKKGNEWREVLKGVSGWAEPGEMIAVMGPSGREGLGWT